MASSRFPAYALRMGWFERESDGSGHEHQWELVERSASGRLYRCSCGATSGESGLTASAAMILTGTWRGLNRMLRAAERDL